MVEFAMVLPIFMLVLSGVCDFGFMLYQRMTVISAAREGARAAAMAEDPSRIVSTAQAAAETAASNGGVTLTVASSDVACLQTSVSVSLPPPCTFDTGSASSVKNRDSVVVTVTYTYHWFFPVMLAFQPTINLSSTVQMVFDNLPG
jgi:Flp pilus assembly protein TadG